MFCYASSAVNGGAKAGITTCSLSTDFIISVWLLEMLIPPEISGPVTLTLNEGHTPLIYCENLSQKLDIELYVKYEGANPTGSFKDRGMVMAVTKAKEQGKKVVICASTGNTSASAAAYAARAGLKAIVVIPEGKIALGKLSQAVMYGVD